MSRGAQVNNERTPAPGRLPPSGSAFCTRTAPCQAWPVGRVQSTVALLGPVPAEAVAERGRVARMWARLRGGETVPGRRTLKVVVATMASYLLAGPLPGD